MKTSDSDDLKPIVSTRRPAILRLDNFKSFIGQDPHWIALLLWTASVFPLLFNLGAWPHSDVRLYRAMASSFVAGEMPYRDHDFGYPPYSIPIFLIPWLFNFGERQPDIAQYQFAFAVLVLIADSTIKYFLLLEGSKQQDRLMGLLPLAMYCLSIPFVRYFYLQRYDIFPSFITLSAICCFARGYYGWSAAFLMIGAGIKIYPALVVPALWSLAVRRQAGVRFMTGGGMALIPLALLTLFLPWWRFLGGHSERGVQVESLYASIIWLGHLLGLTEAAWTHVGVCFEVKGPLVLVAIPCAKGALMIATLTSIAFSTWVASRCSDLTIYQISRLMLVPLLPFIVFNLVFSPQYMIWLLPLAALGLLGGKVWPMVLIAIAAATTPIFFPSPQYVTGLNLGQTLVLLCRNISLVIVWLALLKEFWRAASQGNTRCEPKE